MYVKESEANALHAVIDFLSHATDGADDQEYYEKLGNELQSLWEKSIRQVGKRKYKTKRSNLN